MEPLILFDAKKCIACHSCEVACQFENDAPPNILLRRVRTHVAGKLPSCSTLSISTACFHCNDPSCVSACPAGALNRKSNGIVEHARNRCIGCGYCIQTCPFHVPQFSPEQHTMRKCSFCIQRIENAKAPACVAKCATGALTFFPNRQDVAEIAAYGKSERLHMIYKIDGEPQDYSLPEPVPLNPVTSFQLWKWLAGLVPGAALLAWLWKSAEDQETGNE
jgi:Fe-S-cluster-containing dehydrogenase component